MGAYQYQALNQQGKQQNGVIQADGPKHARELLRRQNLSPLNIVAVEESVTQQRWFGSRSQRIKLTDLALLTRQLATLADAGLPIEECVATVAEQTDKIQVKTILSAVRAKVLEGYSLATALATFPKAFDDLYCATVAAGEQTGKLSLVLNRLADYTDSQMNMRSKVLQALIYPLMMTFVSISIVLFLLVFVVPKIVDVFASTGQVLPLATRVLLDISDFLRRFGWLLFLGVVGAISLFRLWLRNPIARLRYHTLLLRFAPTAYFQRTINTARYARTLGILTAAGVEVISAMRVAADLVSNRQMLQIINDAGNKVREGTTISQALKQTGYFNPMTLHLISSGESSGRLADMLERAANIQDAEVSRLIAIGLTLFEPMIILLMGSVVLFIVLAILLPIFQMDQFVG